MFLVDSHPNCPTNSYGQPIILDGGNSIPWKQQVRCRGSRRGIGGMRRGAGVIAGVAAAGKGWWLQVLRVQLLMGSSGRLV